jgi:hypothetical protein
MKIQLMKNEHRLKRPLIVTKRPFPLKYKYKRYKLDRKDLTHFESIKPHKTVLTDSLAYYSIFTARFSGN